MTGVQTCALPICFLYCPFLVAAAPQLFILLISPCGSTPLFILPGSRCSSAPAFYTNQLALRQRTRFLYCPFLVAAAPLHFILPISRCGSAPLFILLGFRCGSAHAFFTDHFSLRQRPLFLYCPFLIAVALRFLYCLVFVATASPFFTDHLDRKSTRLNSSHVK